jgi:hypothetical protein
MHKMRKKCAQNAQERDKDAQKMASQKVPQIVAKSVPVLPSIHDSHRVAPWRH